MSLASNAEIDDFGRKAGAIVLVELLDEQGRRCGLANADHARVHKRTFDKRLVSIRCEIEQAVALAGPQCLEGMRA